jgi:NADH:ubiquinone oxidoreductase subunit C
MDIKEIIFGKGTKSAARGGGGADPANARDPLPVKNIAGGVIVTKDARFVKIIEVLPVNFHLKTAVERQNIIYSFASYLKTAPDTLQFRVVTGRLDLEAYIEKMKGYLESETNEKCREMIRDNIREVSYAAANEVTSRRFFIAFEYEAGMKAKENTLRAIAERLAEEAETARRYLELCGIETIVPEYADNAALEVLYGLVNKNTSRHVKLPEGVFDMLTPVHGVYG